jgi:GGDEF domain-containing protein
MQTSRALEQGLLKNLLTDPVTGLPNELYADLMRDREEARARRSGGAVVYLSLHVRGGNEQIRRMLVIHLCTLLRDCDVVASEGWHRLLVLASVRTPDDRETVVQRILDSLAELNEGLAPEVALSVELEPADQDAADASAGATAPRARSTRRSPTPRRGP